MKKFSGSFRFSQPVGAVVFLLGVILATVGGDNVFRVEGLVLIALSVVAMVFGRWIDRLIFPADFFEISKRG